MSNKIYERYLKVEGNSYERGLQIGKLLKPRIEVNYLNQRRYFKETYNYDFESLQYESEKYIKRMEKYAESTLKEMEGMADGCGMSLERIVSISTAYEKLMTLIEDGSKCTAFAATKSATLTGGTICGQNNDERIDEWPPQLDVIIHHKDETGRETLMYTHSGIPGHMGMNNRGVGLLLTYIDNGVRRDGIPSYIIPNEVLNKDTFEEAVEYLKTVPHEVPNEFIISDKSGKIASVECFPNKVYVDYGKQDDYVAHSNHIIIGKQEPEKSRSWSTVQRLETMEKMIRNNLGHIDVNKAKSFLSSHENFPASICVHHNVHGITHQTRPSMIFDLEKGDMHMAFGCPCEYPFEVYKFDKYTF